MLGSPLATRLSCPAWIVGLVLALCVPHPASAADPLARWRASLEGVGRGQAATIIIEGDSTAAGFGGGPPADGSANGRERSFPSALATRLASLRIPASTDSFFGDGNSGDKVRSFDPRITFDEGWNNKNGSSIGGYFFVDQVPGASISFHTQRPCNAFEAYSQRAPGMGALAVSVDHKTIGAVDLDAPKVGFFHSHWEVAQPFNEISFRARSAALVDLIGVACLHPRSVNILNMAWAGAKSNEWSSKAYDSYPRNVLSSFPTDLTIIDLGINDWRQDIPLGDFRVHMTDIVAAAKALGDVVVMLPPRGVGPMRNKSAPYLQVIKDVAHAHGALLFDADDVLQKGGGSTEYSDEIHPNGAGYAILGTALADRLVSPPK